MFKFIENEELEKNITNEYIDELENKMNIKFPNILREYYLKHNFANTKECTFKLDGIEGEFILDFIIPLKYGTCNFEKEYEYVLENECISNEYIPLAVDMDGDNYYWHSKSGKVYYISHENVENPILICDSVVAFFEILNKCYDEEITIPNFNNSFNENTDLTKFVSQNNTKNINIEKILKYNGKFVLICILIGIILTIISVALIPVTDSLSVILAGVFGIYTLIFIIINIINYIKSNNALKKYDINVLKKELETAIKLDGIDTYLTDNYIISNSKTIKITKYSDIEWTFIANTTGRVFQRMLISSSYRLGGIPVIAYLKNGKKDIIAFIKNEINANMIFSKIRNENNGVLIGNTLENAKKYKSINPKYEKDSDKIAIIIAIAIVIATLICSYINK